MIDKKNKKCTVLVVEDDKDVRESMKDALELEGYQVKTASNGMEGLATLKESDKIPCLILLDILMPVMGGREFMDNLKKDSALSEIPVLIHSSIANKDNTTGSIGFIKKPADLFMILQTIKTYCV